MAFSSVAATATSTVTSNSTSHTVQMPSGRPYAVGTLIIIRFAVDSGTGVTWPSGTDDGFIGYFGLNHEGDIRLAIAYRRANGNEPDTVTVTTSSSQKSAHISKRYQDHEDPDTQAPESSTGNAQDNNGNPNPDSITPTGGPKDFLYAAVCASDDNKTMNSGPSGFANFLTVKEGSGAGCVCSYADLQENSSSQDPGTFSLASNQESVACTDAVHPVAVAGVHQPQPWRLKGQAGAILTQ